SVQGPHQRFLLTELLRDYNPMERPVANDSQALTVQFSFILMQIMDVDEKNQIITTNAWLQMQWYDHYLRWNQSEYPGVKNLRFTPDQVWTPDILLYNSAHDKFDATFKSNVLVNSSGFCEYLPPGIFTSTCNVDVRWFPFDIQRCELKFGSWTFDGWLLDLQMKEADVSGYVHNGEWDLLEVPGGRHEVFYDGSVEPYPDVTFVVTLRRRTLFYALNLLIPCVLLSSMTLLVFLLPANSGEKISLGITVLLSLTVFMLMVAEIMPATSDSVPLIGQYFASTMVIVGMSVVATVIVLQFHHHNPDNGQMPRWVHLLLLQWIPWFLRMKRPGETDDPNAPHSLTDSYSRNRSSPGTSSRSSSGSTAAAPANLGQLSQTLSRLCHQSQLNGQVLHMGFRATTELELPQRSSAVGNGGVCDEDGGEGVNMKRKGPTPSHQNTQLEPQTTPHLETSPGPSGVESASPEGLTQSNTVKRQLQALLAEVQFLVERVKEQDRQLSLAEQWQFAASVLDRLFLVGFSVFNVICTIAILMAAPNFGEALSKDFI
uniref:Uncharacterized protein n=2 Tax=Tetraodon nigroviridis TaxID=99883 RepID=H3DLU0_TETNG